MVFLKGSSSRLLGPWRCSTLRWCLKKETSFAVVSMRSTRWNLSYIFTWALPRRCLMQAPSMRVSKREPISWASCGVIFLPRNSPRARPSPTLLLAGKAVHKGA